MLSKEGQYTHTLVGNTFTNNIYPQFTVPGGVWFASEVIEPNTFALVGCSVSPGFDFRNFELAKRDQLLANFPKHKDVITRLTRLQ